MPLLILWECSRSRPKHVGFCIHVGDSDGNSWFWLWPNPVSAITGVWEVNQRPQDFSLSLCHCLSHSVSFCHSAFEANQNKQFADFHIILPGRICDGKKVYLISNQFKEKEEKFIGWVTGTSEEDRPQGSHPYPHPHSVRPSILHTLSLLVPDDFLHLSSRRG